MRLKHLHIKGFKSFANDTQLNFGNNVIGIVGPNGSGKSNIVDAFRWVLGEQKSKELRLEQMGDVIFNGTKSKKGSASATVALTFENDKGIIASEYTTVTVSRTLYKSGESEYRLNNVICRLKDITSLFIDTGIGSNSYAIIALGMVDDILEDKDHARLKMFEQASGISKYKIRKRETLNKLKGATEDLNRIDDLLFEIETNLKSLEKQAKRTQKFFTLKEEYKVLSIQFAIFNINKAKSKYKGLAEDLAQKQDAYRKEDTLMLQLETQIEIEKKQNLDKELALSSSQKTLNELVYKIRQSENEKSLIKQKIEFLHNASEQLIQTLEQEQRSARTLDEEIINIDKQLANVTTDSEKIFLELETSESAYVQAKKDYQLVKLDLDEKQNKKLTIEKQLYDAEKLIAVAQSQLINYNQEHNHENETFALKSEEIKKKNDLKSNADKRKNELLHRLEELNSNEDLRKQKIRSLEEATQKLKEKLEGDNRAIDAKQNEYDLLKNMIERYEGFPESIKYLSESRPHKSVLLTDILDVKDDYKTAVEHFLEPYLNYFIVDSFEEAFEGIQLLQKSQKGKANFFILDQLPTSSHSNPLHFGISALDVVDVTSEYQNLINNLLKNCYIVDHKLNSNDIEFISKHPYTVVHQDGSFIYQNTVLSGGSVGLFEGKKIGRKQNVQKLEKQIDQINQSRLQLKKQIEQNNQDINTLKSNDKEKELQDVRQQLSNTEKEMYQIDVDIQTLAQTKDRALSKIKDIEKNKLTLDNRLTTLNNQKNDAESQLQILLELMGTPSNNIDLLGQAMSQASENYNRAQISAIKHQNHLDSLKKDFDFKTLKQTESNDKMRIAKIKIVQNEKEALETKDVLIKLDDTLRKLYEDKKNFQVNLGEAEQVYFNAKNKIIQLEDNLTKLRKSQNQMQLTIQTLKDQYSDLKFHIQSIGERIKIEFNTHINDIINKETDTSLDYIEIEKSINQIKSRIENFGDINPLALEAYNEIKIRYEEITTQRQDILEARDTLLNTISEIEKKATAQFMDAFHQVRENFIMVFRSLFTEDDTCDLILLNPETPLESGIEIIAKPKGKKPKSLSQLSGGEKTLTATALLFSLYLLKPAPFCIFDEVDAPLDDANIQKFNKIIQKFSTESQFIIVTHNKSTMAEVDVLYGVYMTEPGVSAVAPVDFSALKHEPIFEDIK